MDITKFKEKLGDDFERLNDYVEELKSKHTQAVNESVTGRKTMKARIQELEGAQSKLMERLGLDSLDDMDNLPDAKGQAEALKQFDSKFKRLEKELADKNTALETAQKRFRDSQLTVELQKSLSGHDFIDADVVGEYAARRIEWEGDTPFYKTDDGKLLNLADGVKHLAAAKPNLLKAQGSGGSGFGKSGESGKSQKNPWAKETFNLTEQLALKTQNPTLAAQYEAAAS